MANVIYRGESKDILFQIKNANGQPANILGAVATFRMTKGYATPASITKVASLTNPAVGVINVFIDEADTDDLELGPYLYELVIELDGNTTVAAQGTIHVLYSILEG